MLFNSLEFAIFLPLAFLLYWFVFGKNAKLQNAFLIAASCVFYAWWDAKFLALIAFASVCTWGSGLLIERFRVAKINETKLPPPRVIHNRARRANVPEKRFRGISFSAEQT